MKIFKISAVSPCGSFFAAYLQSITIFAESKEDAIQKAKQWQAENAEFEKGHKVEIEEIKADKFGVFDWVNESDY